PAEDVYTVLLLTGPDRSIEHADLAWRQYAVRLGSGEQADVLGEPSRSLQHHDLRVNPDDFSSARRVKFLMG
ncbi:MAG: hypothetical protein ACLPXM_03705, partial [Terriglobales bacterium]